MNCGLPITKAIELSNSSGAICNTDTTNIDKLNQLALSVPHIHEQLAKINATVSGIPDGSYYVAIVGSLSSVLAAFIFNYLYWRRIEKKKKYSSIINEYFVVLSEFEEVATTYWLTYIDERTNIVERNKDDLQSKRIISNASLMRKCGDRIVELANSDKLGSKFKKFDDEIYDLATKDDFGSTSSRNADLKIVGKIIEKCTKMKMLLSSLKD